jgi:hypothetical protein
MGFRRIKAVGADPAKVVNARITSRNKTRFKNPPVILMIA